MLPDSPLAVDVSDVVLLIVRLAHKFAFGFGGLFDCSRPFPDTSSSPSRSNEGPTPSQLSQGPWPVRVPSFASRGATSQLKEPREKTWHLYWPWALAELTRH